MEKWEEEYLLYIKLCDDVRRASKELSNYEYILREITQSLSAQEERYRTEYSKYLTELQIRKANRIY